MKNFQLAVAQSEYSFLFEQKFQEYLVCARATQPISASEVTEIAAVRANLVIRERVEQALSSYRILHSELASLRVVSCWRNRLASLVGLYDFKTLVEVCTKMFNLCVVSRERLVATDKITASYEYFFCQPRPSTVVEDTSPSSAEDCKKKQEYMRNYFWAIYPGFHASRQLTGLDHVFDSYMVPLSDLKTGDLRLLEVTQHLVVPINTRIRLIVTSADVLHSWAVPSLGIKIDACPGRLNQVSTKIFRRCILYGQCSEICGINHAFMPIKVEAASISSYRKHVWQNYTAGSPRLM